MLWIAKITSGVAVDGKAEFSMFVVDDKGNTYDVATSDVVYEQLLDIIAESLGAGRSDEGGDEVAKTPVDDEVKGKLASLLSAPPSTPQHSVEGEKKPTNGEVSLASVGFDLDYSASMDVEEEEEDPGEEMNEEDRYVGPL